MNNTKKQQTVETGQQWTQSRSLHANEIVKLSVLYYCYSVLVVALPDLVQWLGYCCHCPLIIVWIFFRSIRLYFYSFLFFSSFLLLCSIEFVIWIDRMFAANCCKSCKFYNVKPTHVCVHEIICAKSAPLSQCVCSLCSRKYFSIHHRSVIFFCIWSVWLRQSLQSSFTVSFQLCKWFD